MMARGHLFPRAYIWGMADTIRAVFAFGRSYKKEPFYLALGIDSRQTPARFAASDGNRRRLTNRLQNSAVICCASLGPVWFRRPFLDCACHRFELRENQTRACGHPAISFIGLAGNLQGNRIQILCLARRGRCGTNRRFAVGPWVRPWEYYNETVGGPANAYLYFADKGIDAELRFKELVKYYNENLIGWGTISNATGKE